MPTCKTRCAARGADPTIRADGRHLIPRKLRGRGDLARPDMDERCVSAGWRDFYEGEIGRRLPTTSRLPGADDREDMARFAPADRTLPNPSGSEGVVHTPNGCASTLQVLNMLEA
jgi:hypothetical protein